jgi:putative ABC transport system permease protein
MPPGFHFPGQTDIWLPLRSRSASRTTHNLLAVARLKPDVSIDQAQADLRTVAAALEQEYPDSNKGRGVVVTRLQDVLVGDVRPTLYLLWGLVAVVLLIACANTATLLLGKATARTREVAVRAALGASRRRIVRQLVTESLLLGLVASACGVVLAHWGAITLAALTPAKVVRLAEIGIDWRVLAFTLVVSVGTSVLFGLVPALYAAKIDLPHALKQGGPLSLGGGRAARSRAVLVASEIALAVVLLTGAGLLVKSLVALHRVDLGYQPEDVVVMRATGVRSPQENTRFFRDVMSRIRALPGVVAVGATSIPPGDLTNSGDGAYFVDRRPDVRDRTRDTNALFTIVAPGTFAALGTPLKSGRDFNEGDVAGRPMVAIVNEALVRESFRGENPIGRTLFCSFDTKEGMTIVGVVGDTRQRHPGLEPIPDCIMPYGQHVYNGWTLNVVIRTLGDPTALTPTLRRVAAGVSPEVPVAFTTMDDTVSGSRSAAGFRTVLFGVFAALAACLAVAGVYGVMAYAVEQRSKEIALRIALGAGTGPVLRLVLRQGLALAALGLVVGLGGAVAAGRFLTTALFEVDPIDLEVYLGVAALLGIVTLIAGYVPARRAAVMDPVRVLKAE